MKKVEEKKKLEEVIVLWKKTSKEGNIYYKGHDFNNNYVVAWVNSTKKNPNEPDIRIYEYKENGKEVASLWEQVKETTNTRYLTGVTNDEDKDKLVAFYDKEENEKRPYIRVYFKETK